ncbi:GNAT family N-acetyltransferase [Alteromonas pelagimontana]|uniref:GNAT family N-acetyltransferase n=1 Tax=Alteromonas pelagimontana TaxID=1858656 RepID=A0A6M4ME53_9ALTE|nr:GNAT family N-acetyltransferase [Alteromonas pelagimontana]QJR80436.1 GNAT family N-acetyltransferase [Alteromonas pelagimontana]
MEVKLDLTEDYASQVFSLYKETWWAENRTLDQTANCIKGSQITVGLFDDEDLVGFARAITDFIFKAIIFDVIVSEKHRGKGLGKKLIIAVKEHPKLHSIKHFELYCLPEMESFYEGFGFTSNVGGIHLMRCTNA